MPAVIANRGVHYERFVNRLASRRHADAKAKRAWIKPVLAPLKATFREVLIEFKTSAESANS